MSLRRGMAVLAGVVALLAGACGTGGDSASSAGGDGEKRRVLVDYKHDQFAGSFLSYFPKRVQVHPGDTVEFRQFWTGEPHTVTMGTLVDELGEPFWEILDPLFRGEQVEIPEEPEGVEPFFEQLPFMADEETLTPIQAAAQPCYLDEGGPDFSDFDVPCAAEAREQPAFNGRQSYYNSGFIPFQGAKGNSFTLPLADDVAPGTYHYYCNFHFVGMSGVVEVVAEDEPILSQDELNRAARDEVDRDTGLLQDAIEAIEAGRGPARLPAVGAEVFDEAVVEAHPLFHAFANEFVPSTVETKVGQKVTWTFDGFHNIAFNVPKYFPVFEVADDGMVTVDKRAFEPIGFPAPERPEEDRPSEDGDEGGGAEEVEGGEEGGGGGEPEPDPITVDGGSFNGSGGFHSTGVGYNDGDRFTLTFTKPGTYLFACLLHPAMVGKVVVK